MKKTKTNKYLLWTPRVLSILFALFIMVFSLDVFGAGLTTGEVIYAFFMHNVPALILLVAAIIAWKYELVGAIVFVLTGLAYLFFTSDLGQLTSTELIPLLIISLPSLIIGLLFYFSWARRK